MRPSGGPGWKWMSEQGETEALPAPLVRPATPVRLALQGLAVALSAAQRAPTSEGRWQRDSPMLISTATDAAGGWQPGASESLLSSASDDPWLACGELEFCAARDARDLSRCFPLRETSVGVQDQNPQGKAYD